MSLLSPDDVSAVIAPFKQAHEESQTDYHIASLACPECGMVSLRIETAGEPSEWISRVIAMRSKVRNEIAAHLTAKG